MSEISQQPNRAERIDEKYQSQGCLHGKEMDPENNQNRMIP